MIKARSVAEELGLAMKIGDGQIIRATEGKAIFYYIADERVDFPQTHQDSRSLLKRVRIEMKQIRSSWEAS